MNEQEKNSDDIIDNVCKVVDAASIFIKSAIRPISQLFKTKDIESDK